MSAGALERGLGEFSFRTRETAMARLRDESFDLLIIGGGITGAASARDAASRGLKVALVEMNDFASGTSSRSSKLIHGGLRYLENFEFHLVFEALAERALLLRTVPHMVRPLPFYFPVYRGDPHGKLTLGLGMWLYDLLALFRAPGFHRNLSRKTLLQAIPFLRPEGLQGGFRYFDASMWDDVLAVETLRSAHAMGTTVSNYVEAVEPLWDQSRIVGFRCRDREKPEGRGDFELRASQVVVCAGPWTDELGARLSPHWRGWLSPSKGVHLIFDLKRIPVPGAIVMSHPEDGRISFVIPRPDFGSGVVIVGTTDGPTPKDPRQADIDPADVRYLMSLLQRYFPSLHLTTSDILSAYVGVRPLMGAQASTTGSEMQAGRGLKTAELQKVSREHYIGNGPGGTVLVAGGKYTTSRKIAEEVVDYTLKFWRREHEGGRAQDPPPRVRAPRTEAPINPMASGTAIRALEGRLQSSGRKLPEELLSRYGAEAEEVARLAQELAPRLAAFPEDPPGFPMLAAQLVFGMRTGMVMHLEDFYLRRIPLYASRGDHGLPWAEPLSRLWAAERGLTAGDAARELESLSSELARRSAWKQKL